MVCINVKSETSRVLNSMELTPYGIVYIARHKINGKVYVGQTVRTLTDRQGKHRYDALIAVKNGRFNAAIREYGLSAFEFREISQAFDRDELDQMETCAIAMNESCNPEFGYNISPGGHSSSPETRHKLALANAVKSRR